MGAPHVGTAMAHAAYHGGMACTNRFVVCNELNCGTMLPMRYTPSQTKEALEISEEKLRYWRSKLAPLNGKRGYAPCFLPSDLLALSVVTKLNALGVSVGHLQGHAQDLFAACSSGAWLSLRDRTLLFDGQAFELVGADAPNRRHGLPCISVPLSPLIGQLQRRLSGEDAVPTQPQIKFPPLGVAQRRAK